MTKRTIFSIVILICLISVFAYGQKLTINTDLYPNFTKDYGRSFVIPYGGLSLNFHYQINNRELASGINFRSIAWGNEISIDQEVLVPVFSGERINLVNVSAVHLSYPLFYNKKSLSFGLSSRFQVSNAKMKRLRFYAGMRFSYNNSYRQISQQAAILEARIGMNFVLKN